MELTENYTEIKAEQAESNKKKRKNPFNKLHQKDEKIKRNEKRARIIIRNISYKATDESLKKHFAQFGQLNEVNLLKRPDGRLVGCAFVQYETVNQAAKAIINCNNKEFLGRPVYVDWAVGKDVYIKKNETKIKSETGTEVKSEKTCDENVTESKEPGEIGGELSSEKQEENNESADEFSDDEDIPKSDSGTDTKKNNKHNVKEESREKRAKSMSNDVVEGCTIFIKNVPFDATNNDIRKVCGKYGPVYYALINTDPVSGHPKGTAFVKFKTKESADLCLRAGEEFILMDTVMEPFPALTRDDIRKKTESSKNKESKDSRNLYLAKEGLIMAGSKAAEGVSASDMSKRHKLEQIKTQILKNLNRFVSRNRLSIHNIPANYDNDKLRKMVLKFTELKAHECRVMRENKPTAEHPEGKCKGFGFVSFKTHQEALTALRKLNNNPSIFGSVNRPIVAFSIEDRSVHNIKEKRLKKSRENNPTYKEKMEKRLAKKKQKKQNLKDDKNQVGKEINNKLQQKKVKQNEENQLDDFAGVSAKPGTFVRMRSTKKIKAQAKEHSKKISTLKKIEKRKKEKLMLRQEKKEKDRPKQGKKKSERDNFSHLVDKYKRLIDSAAQGDTKKSKRKKWYME